MYPRYKTLLAARTKTKTVEEINELMFVYVLGGGGLPTGCVSQAAAPGAAMYRHDICYVCVGCFWMHLWLQVDQGMLQDQVGQLQQQLKGQESQLAAVVAVSRQQREGVVEGWGASLVNWVKGLAGPPGWSSWLENGKYAWQRVSPATYMPCWASLQGLL
jgi:hypothetical protein